MVSLVRGLLPEAAKMSRTPAEAVRRFARSGGMFLNSSRARVVIHVLAHVLLHVLAPFSTILAHVVIHVLAHVLLHMLAPQVLGPFHLI